MPLFLISAGGAMITGGFIEEFIYRGLMVDRLHRICGGGRRSLWLAALLCGVPFGLVHFQWGVGGMLVTAVMGSVLGFMYLATGRNLWPLIAAHATLDFVLMLQVYLGVLTA
jgi:membrane protease YdiL (CAAX protease family)